MNPSPPSVLWWFSFLTSSVFWCRYLSVVLFVFVCFRVTQASYGQCAHNADWPQAMARRRDKNYVMQRHKFCFAIENNLHEDYVTEKVWDCIAAGAVPIYRGMWVRLFQNVHIGSVFSHYAI